MQYLVLADSTLLVEGVDGRVQAITDDREANIGSNYRTEMDALQNGTPEHDFALADYVRAMHAHRNRTEGFWVAASDPEAAQEAIAGALSTRNVSIIALLSDGSYSPHGSLPAPNLAGFWADPKWCRWAKATS